MLGHVAGYRRQGKEQMHWLDGVKETTGLQLEVLKETRTRKKMAHAGGRKDVE